MTFEDFAFDWIGCIHILITDAYFVNLMGPQKGRGNDIRRVGDDLVHAF